MTKKPTSRIHNPITGSYYKIRQKDTSAGKKGSIIGKWKPVPAPKPQNKRRG